MLVFLLGCSPEEKQTFSEDVWEKEVSRTHEKDFYAPHKKDDRYFAPWMNMPDNSFLDVLGWKFFS
jgi:hypothetical protein